MAHVDAGKTSLTERLLYATGVIDTIGRVDDGNTQTDTMVLERQRGITIKSAVASFVANDTTINLIDTPGHPDFIAEVERALRVLDGAVLVVSAIAGVQPQTRILMRTLQRLRIPTIIFVNKIDRLPVGELHEGEQQNTLVQTITDKLHINSHVPILFGSAMTGVGITDLLNEITRYLPAAANDSAAPVAGTVFKIDREKSGDKVAYARLFTGTIRIRQQLGYGQQHKSKVTSLQVFEQGSTIRKTSATTGQIVKIGGLANVRVGDRIGEAQSNDEDHIFTPPMLETAIVPVLAADKGRLYAALSQLAEQDPLINLRQDDVKQELYLSLYGEVQKEVIQATLANDFGLEVTFRDTTVICVERPNGIGEAIETGGTGDDYLGSVGLRVQPAGIGPGRAMLMPALIKVCPAPVPTSGQ